jgi:hypothetical protein
LWWLQETTRRARRERHGSSELNPGSDAQADDKQQCKETRSQGTDLFTSYSLQIERPPAPNSVTLYHTRVPPVAHADTCCSGRADRATESGSACFWMPFLAASISVESVTSSRLRASPPAAWIHAPCQPGTAPLWNRYGTWKTSTERRSRWVTHGHLMSTSCPRPLNRAFPPVPAPRDALGRPFLHSPY